MNKSNHMKIHLGFNPYFTLGANVYYGWVSLKRTRHEFFSERNNICRCLRFLGFTISYKTWSKNDQ